jgi:hypothetical protein
MNVKKLIVTLSVFALIAAGCGAVDEQQVEEILSGVAQTAAAGVTFVPVTSPPDVNSIVQQTFAAMTAQAGGPPAATQPPPAASTGSISGQLGYPAEHIPPMKVTAFLVGAPQFYWVQTQDGQGSYQIDNLPPGTYRVIAYTIGGNGFPADLAGGYTQAVPCGLSVNCTDHSLIDFNVAAGQVTANINPTDWYAPQGTFPPPPWGQAQPTLPPAVAVGSIAGSLMYPAEGIPPLAVIAFHVGGGPNDYYYVTTAQNQTTYQINNLPPGTYHVVAYTIGGGLAGGYSFAVPCGLSVGCTNHALIDVTVNSAAVTSGITPGDFYAPPGTFPAYPLP